MVVRVWSERGVRAWSGLQVRARRSAAMQACNHDRHDWSNPASALQSLPHLAEYLVQRAEPGESLPAHVPWMRLASPQMSVRTAMMIPGAGMYGQWLGALIESPGGSHHGDLVELVGLQGQARRHRLSCGEMKCFDRHLSRQRGIHGHGASCR